MSFMHRNSFAASNEEAVCTHKLSGEFSEAEAWLTGAKWHHAAGHSSGRPVILFYAVNSEQMAAVDALAEKIKERKAAKKTRRFPSKAAAWRFVAEKRTERSTDAGFGWIDVRNGKFGLFVSSFGTPDFQFYFADDAEADDLCLALKLER